MYGPSLVTTYNMLVSTVNGERAGSAVRVAPISDTIAAIEQRKLTAVIYSS